MDSGRYLGSDDGLRRIKQSQELVSQSVAGSMERAQSATDAFFASIARGQQQITQAQQNLLQARAQNIQRETGLESLGKVVTQGFELVQNEQKLGLQKQAQQYEQYKDERDYNLKVSEIQRKLTQEQLAEFQKAQLKDAESEISQLQATFEANSWDEGDMLYRSEAAKVMSRYNLSQDGLLSLTKKVNDASEGAAKAQGQRLREGIEKARLGFVQSKGVNILTALSPQIQQLRSMPPTEQARPILEFIQNKLDEFMRSDDGLNEAEKFQVLNQVLPEVQKAYADKGQQYGEYDKKIRALAVWNQSYPQLLAQYEATKGSDPTGALGAFKDGINRLRIETGEDFSSQMVGINEAQRLTAETVNISENLRRVQEQARQSVGKQFDFGDGFSRWIAANAALDQNFASQLESNAYINENPAVKLALSKVKRLQEYREAAAKLGVTQASTQRQILELDLSNANNFLSVTRSLAEAGRNNRQLTPVEQLAMAQVTQLRQLAASGNPEAQASVAAIDAELAGRRGSGKDVQQLQAALQVQSQAIRAQQQSLLQEYTARQQQLASDYRDVFEFFGGDPLQNSQFLRSVASQGTGEFQERIKRAQEQINSAASGAVGGQQVGTPSNFASASGWIATTRGVNQFRVAPLTAVNLHRNSADKGTDFITPVQAGFNSRHSFDTGRMGGGYRAGRVNKNGSTRLHAGIDFPFGGGGKNAVSVVSGMVINVGNQVDDRGNGYGGYVDILGDNGYVYRFAHIKPFVARGGQVAPGQAVGSPDGSGTGSAHLHFEVRTPQRYFAGQKYGFEGTIDPIAHLRELTALQGQTVSNVGTPRMGNGLSLVNTNSPSSRASQSTFVTDGGVGITGGFGQLPGGRSFKVDQVFTAQRPAQKGMLSNRRAQNTDPRPGDPMGYAFLSSNPLLLTEVHNAARELNVPAHWIADIIAQESGQGALARRIHPGSVNQNYGLFGFGSDSGVKNHTSLNEVQQVRAYVNYMKTNGWLKHQARVGAGNTTIGQFWALTRMGTGFRKQILEGRAPGLLQLNDTGKTFADEIKLLGRYAGREYDEPGGSRVRATGGGRNTRRSRRNSSSRSNRRSYHNPTNQFLASIDSEVDYL